MKYDIILCGVGGQGGLSAAAIFAAAAMRHGLHVKQNEIHGMSQRGGAVVASLRLSDRPIYSDLIPQGSASLILAMEPLEGLRYLSFLDLNGRIVSATAPVKNISDYPEIETVFTRIRTITGSVLIDADKIAREAGSTRALNVVMVGAASKFIPIPEAVLRASIAEGFARKGPGVVEMNLKAFELGRAAI